MGIPVPSLHSMYQLQWYASSWRLAHRTATFEGRGALFPVVYQHPAQRPAAGEDTLSIHCPTDQGPSGRAGRWCCGLPFKVNLSHKRKQGFLEKWLILGSGQEIHKLCQKVKKCSKNKDGACQRGHRSHPGRAPKGRRWSNLNNKKSTIRL